VMQQLLSAVGSLLSAARLAPRMDGGWRGYVADPDGHAWEIADNPRPHQDRRARPRHSRDRRRRLNGSRRPRHGALDSNLAMRRSGSAERHLQSRYHPRRR